MKKILFIMTLLAVSLTSCLKDKHYLDFADAGNIVNFPQSGLANFSADAVTSDTAVIKFAVDYATSSANKALTVTLAIDPTLIAKYNAANPAITYQALPTTAYSFPTTTVTIPAGQQYVFVTLTVYKNTLDPSLSYMLPIKIASANGVAISANQSVHYFHVIGNDFGGAYNQRFQRYNTAGDTTGSVAAGSIPSQAATFSPVSPTEFTVASGYASGDLVYDVTFTKTGTGASATYSNFAVSFTPASVKVATGDAISVTSQPVFLPYPGLITQATATPAGPFTFAQALKIFHFEFGAMTTAARTLIDTYHK